MASVPPMPPTAPSRAPVTESRPRAQIQRRLYAQGEAQPDRDAAAAQRGVGGGSGGLAGAAGGTPNGAANGAAYSRGGGGGGGGGVWAAAAQRLADRPIANCPDASKAAETYATRMSIGQCRRRRRRPSWWRTRATAARASCGSPPIRS